MRRTLNLLHPPCLCKAYPFPHKEGGGKCPGKQLPCWRCGQVGGNGMIEVMTIHRGVPDGYDDVPCPECTDDGADMKFELAAGK